MFIHDAAISDSNVYVGLVANICYCFFIKRGSIIENNSILRQSEKIWNNARIVYGVVGAKDVKCFFLMASNSAKKIGHISSNGHHLNNELKISKER